MSLSQFFADIGDGNISHAWSRAKDWFSGLPPAVQAFIDKEGAEEFKILQGLLALGEADIVANGFTTASFIKAGKDILAQLIAQNIQTFTLQDVIANLNIAISSNPAAQAVQAAQVAAATPAAVS